MNHVRTTHSTISRADSTDFPDNMMLDREKILKNALTIVLALALCVGCSRKHPSQVQPVAGGEAFFVHLQEGFSGEPVRVLVDGELLFEGKPTTDPRLGIAEEFSGSASSTNINLTIEIPSRSIKRTHSVDLAKAKSLGISVHNGKVSMVQANSFAYD